MPELAVVQKSTETEAPPKRKPNLYRVLASRLEEWEPADYNDEFLTLLGMLRECQVPKRYKELMVRAVVAAYINFNYMSDDEKDQVADTINSLDGNNLVREIYHSSLWESRTYILLHHLGYHMRSGLGRG